MSNVMVDFHDIAAFTVGNEIMLAIRQLVLYVRDDGSCIMTTIYKL